MIAPAATDLQISGAASTGSPAVGSTFTYTYQVKNAGQWGTYGGLVFADTLPASLTYVSSSVTQPILDKTTGLPVPLTWANTCSVVGQTVMCPLRDMTNSGVWNQATVTVTVAAPAVAQQTVNTASIHPIAPQDDPSLTNNSVTVTVATK